MAEARTDIFVRNRRHQQWTIGLLGLGLLLIGMAPRNERAMFFVTQPRGAQVFAAIVPPIGYLPPTVFDDGTILRRLARDPFVRRSGGTPPPPTVPQGPSGAPVLPGDGPAFAANDAGPSFVPGTAGSGFPTQASQGLPLGGSSPVGPSAGPDEIAPLTPITPIAAVPEPATWAMLILGFSTVGFLLRRRRARASARGLSHVEAELSATQR